ncbi:thioredoxin family protein [Vulcanisaeta thermophila]|uniref:thioredoxin family protein n=1 Tax=Vulcanisaeta thermophila TaxID=867917 RepID=UPI0008534124|nr:thioredoxin family protein [Vulcanisaeta thermophila]
MNEDVKIEVFIHPTCSTCHTLIKMLSRWGYLDRVSIIDTSKEPYIAMERGVRSVPSIFINGELVFAGIVDFKALKAMLDGLNIRAKVEVSIEELTEDFFKGVLDTISTALWLYINADCRAFLEDRDFVMAIMNLKKYANYEELYKRLSDYLGNEVNCGEGIRAREERFLRVIARNFAREVYWLHGKALSWGEVSRLYPREVIAHWMIVRSTLGRVGLRIHRLSEGEFRAKVDRVYEYLNANFDSIISEVAREQEEIFSDKEFLSVIERV